MHLDKLTPCKASNNQDLDDGHKPWLHCCSEPVAQLCLAVVVLECVSPGLLGMLQAAFCSLHGLPRPSLLLCRSMAQGKGFLGQPFQLRLLGEGCLLQPCHLALQACYLRHGTAKVEALRQACIWRSARPEFKSSPNRN